MSPLDDLAVAGVGVVAGTMNVVVGGGSLVSFPALLALGYPPVLANVTNRGLVIGTWSGVHGYRRELSGQRPRVRRLAALAVAGGLTGAALLLVLPQDAFRAVVPALLLVATVLMAAQPYLARRLRGRAQHSRPVQVGFEVALFLAAVYGGYFGAGQGVLYLSTLAILITDSLQRINALKNVFSGLVGVVSTIFLLAQANVDWLGFALLAAGAVLGGQLGAIIGRRLPPIVFRVVIVVIGIVASVRLLI